MPERDIEDVALALTREVRDLRAAIGDMRRDQQAAGKKARRRWWVFLLVVVPLVAVVGFNVGYVQYSNRQADQRWCALLRGIDQPAPPGVQLTERQRMIARQLHELRLNLHCS